MDKRDLIIKKTGLKNGPSQVLHTNKEMQTGLHDGESACPFPRKSE